MRRTLSIVAILCASFVFSWLMVLAVAHSAEAQEAYVGIKGGCSLPLARSNNDEIEFGSECGAFGALSYGTRVKTFDNLELYAEAEVLAAWNQLHGKNGQGELSADGDDWFETALMFNGVVKHKILDPVSFYALAGVGLARVTGFDDNMATLALQGEAGLSIEATETINVLTGYRYHQTINVELDNQKGAPNFHMIFIGAQFKF